MPSIKNLLVQARTRLAASCLLPLVSCLAAMILATTSCTRRPLEYEWELGNYADILLMTDWKLLEETPTGLTAIFFPDDGSSNTLVLSNQIRQNPVRLQRGKYHVIVFNQSIYEFGSMYFTRMDGFGTATANLNPLSPSSQITGSDYKWLATCLKNPDSLALGMRSPEFFNADRFTYEVTDELCRRQYFKDNGITDDRTDIWQLPTAEEYVDTIFSTPPPVPPTLYVRCRVKGIQNCYQVKGYITNFARNDRFGPHTNNNDRAIHVLGQWAITPNPNDKTRGIISSAIRCFGVPTQQLTHNDFYLQFPYKEPEAGEEEEWQSNHRSAYGAYSRATGPFETDPDGLQISDRPLGADGERDIESSRALSHLDYGRNILFLEFLLKDGRTHRTYAFDVTDHILYTESLLRLDIEVNIPDGPGGPSGTDPADGDDYPIILPDVDDVIGSGGTGFDAVVEPWKTEHKDIFF